MLIETKGVERVGRKKPRDRPLAPKPSVLSQVDPGADDGIRTRDPHLGKVCRDRWSERYTASDQRNQVTVIPVVFGRFRPSHGPQTDHRSPITPLSSRPLE